MVGLRSIVVNRCSTFSATLAGNTFPGPVIQGKKVKVLERPHWFVFEVAFARVTHLQLTSVIYCGIPPWTW